MASSGLGDDFTNCKFSDCVRRVVPLIVLSMQTIRSAVASLALAVAFILPTASLRAHPAADDMTAAARKFLSSLNSEQKAKASFDLASDERLNWHFVPKERNGLTLKEMSPDQRQLALALLASGLSTHGYQKATNIMSLESILAELEGPTRRFPRDPILYHVFIFGQPDAKGTWGWRFEGHHFSSSFTIVDGKLFASTPSFLGTNPAEVRQGPRQGLRVLGAEEDIARELIKSLSADQQRVAIFDATAPKEIFTEAKRRVEALEAKGIVAAKLDKKQRALLIKLIEEYVNRVRPELAREDLKKIKKAGVDKILFAWAGGIEKGDGHYYRVQGPTFLLEYDNTQNNNNHVHAVWRDFQGDFGADILGKHYGHDSHAK